MNYNIAVIEGDGIGPEIVNAGILALEAVGKKFGHSFAFNKVAMGGSAYDKYGEPLPQSTVDACLQSDSVLLGAVGGPKWDALPGHLRPEAGLLGIRYKLGLYANIRPAKLLAELMDACPLRKDIAEKGFDMVIIRELTGGMYFGERGRKVGPDGEEAFDTECYSAMEIERIGRTGFDIAMGRGRRLCSIDKANVLESSRLWRETMIRLSAEYPEVQLTHMLVDNAAMQLVKNPAQFDVIVTSNMFGDILSDEASQITGSIGLLPSASLGKTKRGLFEPIHGSAPDIAGQDKANPIATVLSAAMMLRLSFGLDNEAKCLENAVSRVLQKGLRTADIAKQAEPVLGCRAMTEAIVLEIGE